VLAWQTMHWKSIEKSSSATVKPLGTLKTNHKLLLIAMHDVDLNSPLLFCFPPLSSAPRVLALFCLCLAHIHHTKDCQNGVSERKGFEMAESAVPPHAVR
jgi:hypothetical protein